MTIRVLLADDQALLRATFRILIDSGPDVLLTGIRTVAAGDSLLSPTATRALITRFLATPADHVPLTAPERLTLLTEREREVMALAALGKSNHEIADQLVLS
ncbi:response regulator transcription factor, partial [Streptomyces sp. enrichment culture]